MNIFFLDKDPKLAAKYHCDKHVIKMILESAQLMSTAHFYLGYPVNTQKPGLYKPAFEKHPCTKWVMESACQYDWLFSLFKELNEEYTFRYGKIHKCKELENKLKDLPGNILLNNWKDPPMAMPDDCKIENNVVESYRNYYIKYKAKMCKWKNREIPDWFKLENNNADIFF